MRAFYLQHPTKFQKNEIVSEREHFGVFMRLLGLKFRCRRCFSPSDRWGIVVFRHSWPCEPFHHWKDVNEVETCLT